jgi:hypothetical protein
VHEKRVVLVNLLVYAETPLEYVCVGAPDPLLQILDIRREIVAEGWAAWVPKNILDLLSFSPLEACVARDAMERIPIHEHARPIRVMHSANGDELVSALIACEPIGRRKSGPALALHRIEVRCRQRP